MMYRPFMFALVLAATASLVACKSQPQADAAIPSTAPANDPQARARSDGYALLHSLLKKEGDVDKALIMRKVDPELESTITAIAQVSRDGAKQIEAYAAKDGSIRLDELHLPLVESDSRDLIEADETKNLLANSFNNDVFLLRLLLTQAKALKYGEHLANALAKQEPDAARRASLEAIAKQYHDLNNRVFNFVSLKTAKP